MLDPVESLSAVKLLLHLELVLPPTSLPLMPTVNHDAFISLLKIRGIYRCGLNGFIHSQENLDSGAIFLILAPWAVVCVTFSTVGLS